jgi:predicted MPP superfamily phosphohydrolase
MGFILFIVTTLTVLLGSHYLLYATVVQFYDIANTRARTVLRIACLLLAVSFIASAFVVRFSGNVITESFAWIAAFWLGMMIHLVAAMALIWLIHGFAKLTGISANMGAVVTAFFTLAATATVYGTLMALRVQVKEVTVTLQDLPEIWRGKTLVHLSDLHLGPVRRAGFLRNVVEQVNALEPEVILITGDLFDGMAGDLSRFAGPLDSLEASQGVYFVSGNHEGYLGLTAPISVLERTGIRVLDDEVVVVAGLQLVGVSFPEFDMEQKARSVSRLSREIDPGKPSILMYHTPTAVVGSSSGRAEQQTRTYLSPDVRFSFARTNGIDLQLSGHTHQGQIFPFTYLTRRIFDGLDYGLHVIDGFSIYVTSGVGTWGPPLRTGSRSEIAAIQLR